MIAAAIAFGAFSVLALVLFIISLDGEKPPFMVTLLLGGLLMLLGLKLFGGTA